MRAGDRSDGGGRQDCGSVGRGSMDSGEPDADLPEASRKSDRPGNGGLVRGARSTTVPQEQRPNLGSDGQSSTGIFNPAHNADNGGNNVQRAPASLGILASQDTTGNATRAECGTSTGPLTSKAVDGQEGRALAEDGSTPLSRASIPRHDLPAPPTSPGFSPGQLDFQDFLTDFCDDPCDGVLAGNESCGRSRLTGSADGHQAPAPGGADDECSRAARVEAPKPGLPIQPAGDTNCDREKSPVRFTPHFPG